MASKDGVVAGTSGVLPVQVKRRSKKSHLTTHEKTLVLAEYKSQVQLTPNGLVADIAQKVAKKTGVCRATVFNVIREYREKGKFSKPNTNQNRKNYFTAVNNFEKNEIRKKVSEFFYKNDLPTIDKVLQAVNDDPELPTFKRTTFYKLLKRLNLKNERRGRNSFLIDKDDIVLWRRDYLKAVKSYREQGKTIYYLGETWVNAAYTKFVIQPDREPNAITQVFVSGSPESSNTSEKSERVMVCHIGSNDGFVPDGLCIFESENTEGNAEERDSQCFENWFATILPKLDDDAVIVLDNMPYQSRKLETFPTSATPKTDIRNWLSAKGIPFEDNMLKLELLRICNRFKTLYTKYTIDEIAKKHNKIIVRLPPYHGELNPIELIWADIKKYIASRDHSVKIEDNKSIFEEATEVISKETWQEKIKYVTTIVETKMWQLDNQIEENSESVINTIKQEQTSSEYSE